MSVEKVLLAVDLFFQEDPSDKVYNVELVEVGGAHTVKVAWGRRGANLQTGTKAVGVDFAAAQKAYDKVVRQKMNKGYEEWTAKNQPAAVAPPVGQGSASKGGAQRRPQIGPRAQLLNSADVAALDGLFDDDGIVAQQKLDGARVIVIVSDGDLITTNREGQATGFSAAVARELADAEDLVLDGERVGDVYWAFDLLGHAGDDLRALSYDERYGRLAQLGIAGSAVKIVETARTPDEKRALFAALQKQSAEGIVFKRRAAAYVAGRPSSGGDQLKHKFVKSADVFVTANAGNAYQMAVYNGGGQLALVGKVFAGTTSDTRAELDKALLGGETPVAEVQYLYATDSDVLFQPVFVRLRDDKVPEDCALDQLVYTDRSVVSG